LLTFRDGDHWWFNPQRNLPQLTGLLGTGSVVKLDRVVDVVGLGGVFLGAKSQGNLLGIGVARRQHYVKPTLGDLGRLEAVARAI